MWPRQHNQEWIDGCWSRCPQFLHGCTLGDRVLVGMGATVMDGAVVGDEVIIAAGALVAPGKRLESGHVYAGNPAKPLRPLKDSERAFFGYTAGNYVKLKDDYLAQPSV